MLEAKLISLLHTKMLANAVVESWMVHAQKLAHENAHEIAVVVRHTFKHKSNRVGDPG